METVDSAAHALIYWFYAEMHNEKRKVYTMKKLLALMMALLMAFACVPAMAESTEAPYTAYVHPVLGCTLEYPTNWLVIDTETLPAVLEMAQQMGMGVEGIDLSMIGDLEAQIVNANMTMFWDISTGANMNIGAQDLGMPIDVNSFATMMMPMLKTQYEQAFAGAVFEEVDPIITIGDTQYCYLSMSYQMNGQTICYDQYYLVDGTVMYTIAGAYAEAADTDELMNNMSYILATFAPAAK